MGLKILTNALLSILMEVIIKMLKYYLVQYFVQSFKYSLMKKLPKERVNKLLFWLAIVVHLRELICLSFLSQGPEMPLAGLKDFFGLSMFLSAYILGKDFYLYIPSLFARFVFNFLIRSFFISNFIYLVLGGNCLLALLYTESLRATLTI